MYLEQNIFGHNLLKFQFNISSLAIFILQSKFKKKYFLIFSSSQPITSPVSRHVILASSSIIIICSPKGCKFGRFAENGTKVPNIAPGEHAFTWHDGLVCFEDVVRLCENLAYGAYGL